MFAPDYRVPHRPPDASSGAPLHDLTGNLIYPADFYDHPDWYLTGHDSDQEALSEIWRVRGRPEARVQIYRAVPRGVKIIQPGDWVAITKSYARDHGRHGSDSTEDMPVITARVQARDLYTQGDSFQEWGYNGPGPVTGQVVFRPGRSASGRPHRAMSDSAVRNRDAASLFLRDADAATELSRAIEQELRPLEHALRLLEDNPDHAGAVFDGLKHVDEILNLLDEARIISGDSKLERALFVTRNFWNARGRSPSNEWIRETGQYLRMFPAQARGWAQTLLKRVEKTPSSSVVIAGIRVRNATHFFREAVTDLRDPIEEAAKAVKSRRWGALLRSHILIIESDQMPRGHRGHAGAMYRSATDDILLVWPPPDERSLVERILHEFGHRLWFVFLDGTYREAWIESWKRIKDAGGRFVTPYAASDPKEDFAEVFAYWALRLPIGDHEARLREAGVAPRHT
jgi:hypothetical protein